MKKTKYLITMLTAVMLSACGGGGDSNGGSTSGTTPTPPVSTQPTPVANTVTNSVTGTAAPGSPTTTMHGMTYANAVVTAYEVQPDGTSGAALGSPATANFAGEFTLNFTKAPTSWVRLVARGGTMTRNVDNTTRHPVESMELVTPVITTGFDYLTISPITDISARIMAAEAKKGATLADAFKTGMQRLLALDSANVFMQNDVTVYMNMLKGAIKSDKQYYPAESSNSRELLTAIERFGVMFDLPANQVWRILGAAGENNYPLSQLDGAGRPINVGAWTGDTFNPAAPVTLSDMLNARTLAEMKVTDPANGTKVAPRVAELVNKYLVMDFAIAYACDTGFTSELATRYPFFALDPTTAKVQASTCTEVRARTSEFQARLSANTSYRVYK